jgi:hypothetical protein
MRDLYRGCSYGEDKAPILSPSRTTVDLDCNLWLGNRAFIERARFLSNVICITKLKLGVFYNTIQE